MKLLLVLVFMAVFVLLGGFVWMICLGALSHIFGVPSLAIGFWPSVLVGVIVSLLLGGLRGSK